MKRIWNRISILAITLPAIYACVDTSSLESELTGLEDRVAALEQTVSKVNNNAATAYALYRSGLVIMDIHTYSDGTLYRLDMSDGSTLEINIAEGGTGITPVLGIDSEGRWTIQVGKDSEPEIIDDMPSSGLEPSLRVSSDGLWQIGYDGTGWKNITDSNGNPVKATVNDITDSFFISVEYDEDKEAVEIVMANGDSLSLPVHTGAVTMQVEGYEEGENICLNEKLHFYAVFSDDVAEAFSSCPDGWRVQIAETEDDRQEIIISAPSSGSEGDYEITVYLQSSEKHLRLYKFRFHLKPVDINEADSEAWKRYISEDENNVLLDFSYAGYRHGETAPPDVTVYRTSSGKYETNLSGYTVYNIVDYGAVPDDGKSDREAFISLLTAISGEPVLNAAGDQLTFPHKNALNAIIYFPEGDFILHTEEDNANDRTQSIIIRGGNLILKGAGRDKTTITMQDPALPSSSALYSSPDMIQLKHNTGVQYTNVLATVTEDSPQGSFSVQTGGAGSIKPGDWVCLYLADNNSPEVVSEELAPYSAKADWVISKTGVTVEDIHQVKSVNGNEITFYEPIMHAVKASWNWTVVGYQHYENVGVEDITFAGNAKERFDHHASWEDDGAYKPISMTRLTDSWIRRVRFHSVSEACSIITSANVSAYDIIFDGTRGHAALRSQGSSRVFIGATEDRAEGYIMDDQGHDVTDTYRTDAGQYHAVGVSKLSIGAVLWRNVWGYDSCFESHATQPRATLIDCCTGGWRRWRQGGDASQMPNHLNDLTVWNFSNTSPFSELSEFIWWDSGSDWWKFLPPVIVGFHGEPVTFDPVQTKYIESNGSAVTPESLYEAQLRERLGYVPAWLTALK